MARLKNLIVLIFLFIIFSNFGETLPFFGGVFAQEETQGQQSSNLDPAEERKVLEDQLKELEKQIEQYNNDITKTSQQKKTLQNQISLLKKKIEKLNLQIQQSNVMINDVSLQISDTENSIIKTSLKIDNSREELANNLRAIYEEDSKSLIEVLLSENELSDFFDNLMALESLNSKSQNLLKEIQNLKSYLEEQRQALDGEKTDLEGVLKIQTLQKQESESNKKTQDSLLKLTESQYQKMLKEKEATQKKAAEIRSRIFELIGVPEAPTFGEALEIAKFVSSSTGIRPAFLLAVLTQESNLGKNVGQCYVTNFETGAGVRAVSNKAENKIMKPSRDIAPFLAICEELGRDPKNTPVSCPIASVGGYGGAMGPAQFIPSTWAMFKARIKDITGKPADPWNIKDAFFAAALYLTDAGAGAQTENAEWKAALVYFSGSVNTKYRFYADSVLNIAAQYEEDIKDLGN